MVQPPDSGNPPDHPGPTPLARTGGYGSRLPWGIVIVLSLVILAVAKPWNVGRAPADASPGVAAAPTAAPTATPEPTLAPGALGCSNYDAWRAVTIEHTLDEEVHRWIAVEPARVLDALDPAIPSVRVVAGRLDGIGFCVPDSLAMADVPHVFRVVDGTATMIDGTATLRLAVPTGFHAARVYQPPQGDDAWAPGRYVVQVLPAITAGAKPDPLASAWFALDVVSEAGRSVEPGARPFSPPPSP